MPRVFLLTLACISLMACTSSRYGKMMRKVKADPSAEIVEIPIKERPQIQQQQTHFQLQSKASTELEILDPPESSATLKKPKFPELKVRFPQKEKIDLRAQKIRKKWEREPTQGGDGPLIAAIFFGILLGGLLIYALVVLLSDGGFATFSATIGCTGWILMIIMIVAIIALVIYIGNIDWSK